jgi:hypothetical protein
LYEKDEFTEDTRAHEYFAGDRPASSTHETRRSWRVDSRGIEIKLAAWAPAAVSGEL